MKKIIILAILLSLCEFPAAAQNPIQIQGADTLILLGQRWGQIYKQRQSIDLSIRGGGPDAGFKALRGGKTDIVQFEGGVRPDSGITFPVGVEGIAVYVHKTNPVNQLTLDQLKAIFLGEITNWKQLGGPDKKIVLYAGESSTGILSYFQETVLHDAEPYPFMGRPSAKELVETVASEPDAIGYSSIYPSSAVKVLRIKTKESAPGIEASIENIRSKRYPISRYLYWHLAKKPTGDLKTLCEWVLSQQGQVVVESVGFEPLTPADRTRGLALLR